MNYKTSYVPIPDDYFYLNHYSGTTFIPSPPSYHEYKCPVCGMIFKGVMLYYCPNCTPIKYEH